MAEFRYQGVTFAGKPMQGTLFATNRFAAKRKINAVAANHGVHIRTLHKRVPFICKVRRGLAGQVVTGEISGFTREEVRETLVRSGYRIVKLRRTFWRLKSLVPNKDVVIFIRLCADLLREKFPYDEILSMLGSNLENRALRDVVREIRRDLKMGKEGREVFLKHANVFGRFTAYMLSIASTSGNMAEIYENTAKFLQRSADFRKNVRGALFMPTIVLLFAFGALIFYVSYIFPEIAGLLLKYDIKVPPMTAATLATSEFLKKNFAWLSLPIGIPLTFLATYFRSERGRVLWHRLIISLPVVGKLIYKTSIEIFLRFFHALYSGSGENIHVIKLAAESCRNAYIEKQIKEQVIPCMLRQGRSFSEALEMFGVFPQDAIYSLRSGEESGALRESALSLANFYEKETTHKMARVIDLINLTLAVFISVVTAGITLLSSEIGFVSPPNPLGR